MSFVPRELQTAEFPPLLAEIPQPPKQLYLCGELPSPDLRLLTIVGSRKYTTYGKQAVDQLVAGLTGYPVGIISGLALGIDGLAHEAALRHNLYTLAILGNGLSEETMYPARNKPLARRILDAGGGLLSEYKPTFHATRWSFPERNRLQAGVSHATLIIEAAEKSGTLITARLATDYNRELLVLPGSIFSNNSAGPHQFLKLGATPVTNSRDILEALRLDPEVAPQSRAAAPTQNTPEALILSLLSEPKDRDTLIRESKLSAQETNTLLMKMELMGQIASEQNIFRKCL